MGYSKYEIIIVASMIQAEAGVSQDRGKIARVIYNRLDEGMALGIDATVIYALGERKNSLTCEDLASRLALQHAHSHGAPADTDRSTRSGGNQGGCGPRRRTVALLRAHRLRRTTLVLRRLRRFPR